MIGDKDYLLGIKNMLDSCLFEFFDSNRGGNVIAQADIHICVNELLRIHLFEPECAAMIFSVIVIPIDCS